MSGPACGDLWCAGLGGGWAGPPDQTASRDSGLSADGLAEQVGQLPSAPDQRLSEQQYSKYLIALLVYCALQVTDGLGGLGLGGPPGLPAYGNQGNIT